MGRSSRLKSAAVFLSMVIVSSAAAAKKSPPPRKSYTDAELLALPGLSDPPRLGLCFSSSFVDFLDREVEKSKAYVAKLGECGTILIRRRMLNEAWVNSVALTIESGKLAAFSEGVDLLKSETSDPAVAAGFGYKQDWKGHTPEFLCIRSAILDQLQETLEKHEGAQKTCREKTKQWRSSHPNDLDGRDSGQSCDSFETGAMYADGYLLNSVSIAGWQSQQVTDKKVNLLFSRLYDGIFAKPPAERRLKSPIVSGDLDPVCREPE